MIPNFFVNIFVWFWADDVGIFRLMLLQEKEQLLRELKGINPKGRSAGEMKDIQQRISQLEYDLNVAVEISNKQIADRFVYILWLITKFPH